MRIIVLIYLLVFLVFPALVFAQSGVMEVNPQRLDLQVGETFDVELKVSGGGPALNAAKATVFISPELLVKNLVLGNCEFAYVVTPTVSSASFAGVILGGSSNSCTAYTLSLEAKSAGTGTIVFSDNAIKSYNGAQDLLSQTIGGSYNITGQAPSPTGTGGIISTQQVSPTSQPIVFGDSRQYDVTFAIPLDDPDEAASYLVVLDPDAPGSISQMPVISEDGTLVATFNGVPEGTHNIKVYKDGKETSSQIINVSGTDRDFVFGAEPKQKASIWPYVLIALFIGLVIAGVVIYFIKFRNKKGPKVTIIKSTNPEGPTQ